MPLIRDAAVVLGRLDYSESSQILVLFTREHGKVRVIAKGAKRSTKTRFAPGVDLLDIGTVVFSVRHERAEGLATLTEWKQTQSLSALRERLDRINAAQYAAETTARLTEDWDPHADLFDELIDTIKDLSESKDVLKRVVRYQLVFLDKIGSLPRFDACVSCERDAELTHFSSFEGGLICRSCEVGRVEKWEIAPSTIELLNRSDGDAAPILSKERDSQSAFSVLNYHIAHLMGMEPRLAESLVPTRLRRRI
jgi:DNA repair protein RecO (recombination protein O)